MFLPRITAGIILVTFALSAFEAAAKGLVWQSGQIVSLKEETSDRDGNWNSYVYGMQGKERTYTVVISAPLKAYLHSTVKFAIDKSLFYIQDLDGKTRKACIIDQSENAPHH